jgi:hypothetical protein
MKSLRGFQNQSMRIENLHLYPQNTYAELNHRLNPIFATTIQMDHFIDH